LGLRDRSGTTAKTAEVRATHRRPKRRYKKRMRMPSKLDPHLVTIESWLATEPQITALAIVRRLALTCRPAPAATPPAGRRH
jgi:hypothetical protein